jgi:hypothetical protein
MKEEDYPSFFQAADDEAKSAQRSYVGLTAATLTLGVSAPVFAITGGLTNATWPWAVLTLVLGLSIVLRWVNRAQRSDQRWFKARALAESVKSSSWRYMMRASPFDEGAHPEAPFVARMRELFKTVPLEGVTKVDVSATEITPRMKEVRAASFDKRRAIYVDERLNNQIGWYQGRAASAATGSRRMAVLSTAAEGAAVVAALLLALSAQIANIVGVGTSLAAAGTAWAQLRRYDEIAPSFELAAQELRLARETLSAAASEDDFLLQVVAAEDSISREHTMWATKRGAL